MLSGLDLKKRWQQAFYRPLDTEEEEYVSVLCESEWVRILAVRSTDSPNVRRIEVEVALPPQSIANVPDDIVGPEVRNFVQNLIKHMEYLLRLDEAGLTLGVMTRDGIYTACLDLVNDPPDSMFDTLLPPQL
ncbi:MAG: hypothetical protein ACFFDM_00405 [Candidatus Thorarchaeota archaeon]